jgi:hypothetical protein
MYTQSVAFFLTCLTYLGHCIIQQTNLRVHAAYKDIEHPIKETSIPLSLFYSKYISGCNESQG